MRSDVARSVLRGAIVLAVAGCFLYPPVDDLTGGSPSGDGGVEAAGGPWCPASSPSSSFFFCRDFDDGGVADGWEINIEADAGTVTLDSTQSSSPPRSALMDYKPGNYDCVYVRLLKSIEASLNHTRLAFDYFIPSDGLPPSYTYGVAVQSMTANEPCNLILGINQSSAQILEQTYANANRDGEINTFHDFMQPLASGQWQRIVIDVDFSAAKLTVTLRQPGDDGSDGGTVVVDVSLSTRCSGTATKLEIGTGFSCVGRGFTAARINFDNVVFEGR